MRLLSYNIHKGIGGRDRRYRLQRIIDVISRERPDLICLQEVDRNVRRSRFDDQPTLLRKQFSADGYLYQMNVHLQTGGYGNLMLSRWPIVRSHQISLRRGRRKHRGAQLAVIDTPQGPLHLVHYHLGLAEQERHWQVTHLIEHRLFRESNQLPTMIVGDTNDWRDTLAAGPFAEHHYHQATAPVSRYRTFPAWLPMGGLDKAFVCDHIGVDHIRVPNTMRTRSASDHRPLVIDFRIESRGKS